MAKFIAISGPSTTGKSSLIKLLKTYPELRNKVVFGSDMFDTIWNRLVKKGLFTEFTEITLDSDYICTYILQVIDYYHECLEEYKDRDILVILDGCWLDLNIYSMLNTWYTRAIRSVQELIFSKIAQYDDRIAKIYITKADDETYPIAKDRLRGKITTFRANRPLEIKYYDIFSHMTIAEKIPTSDIPEASRFIIDDLKNLGYLN